MPKPEDISDEEVRAFLKEGSLAALMAIEMGTTKDPVAIRNFIASKKEWETESASFNRAVRASRNITTADLEARY